MAGKAPSGDVNAAAAFERQCSGSNDAAKVISDTIGPSNIKTCMNMDAKQG